MLIFRDEMMSTLNMPSGYSSTASQPSSQSPHIILVLEFGTDWLPSPIIY